MDNTDKVGLFFGGTNSTKEITTNDKNVIKGNWGAEWLKAREGNLLGSGSLNKPYKQSYIVYRAVRSISENVPQARYKIIDLSKDEAVGIGNPIFNLFANPNRFQSRFEFWESIASYLNLNGEAFIYPVTSVGQSIGSSTLPAELWILDPKKMKHYPDENGFLGGWVWDNKVELSNDEIIHFRMFNSDGANPRGQSPIDAARQELESDYSAAKWNRVFFDNNATPDGVIEIDKDKEIAIEDLRKLREMWYEKHGGTDRSHKTAFLLGGMTYRQMGASRRDMEFIEGRQFSRDSILSVFGVHPFVAGFYDSGTVTRATAKEAKRLFWTGTLKPQLIRIQEKMAVKFFPQYAPGYVGVFDFSGVEELQEDFDEAVITGQNLFTLGYTRNEINARLSLGMPKNDEDGDIRYLPINLVEVGEQEETDAKSIELVPMKQIEHKDEDKAVEADKAIEPIQGAGYRRQFLHFQAEVEKRLMNKIKRFLFSQRSKVLKLLATGFKADLTPEQLQMIGELREIFDSGKDALTAGVEPIYRETTQLAGDMAYRNLGLAADREFFIPEDIIKSRLNLISGMNDTIYEKVRTQIFEGLNAGESIDQITEKIKSVYNTTSNRAKIIARTETASLMNATTQRVYNEEGVTKKQWLTTMDGKERDSHHEIDDEIQPIGEPFTNGLMFPGDPSGEAEEVINCRCSMAPVV